NESVSWKSKKEEFELYCRDLNLYLRDQVVNEDLREKWSELIESQVWHLFWDPSTACFARGPEGILVQLALLVVPGDPNTACFACDPLKFSWSNNTGGITFYYFMDDLKKDLEHNMETVLDEDSATTVTTQTSRSSRSSRSKGPSKSTILRNKQKEKEELDNQILLQEVKDRYETLTVSAPQ
ncbi:1463_t:CDS:2, partial [Funneliformis caledonium]